MPIRMRSRSRSRGAVVLRRVRRRVPSRSSTGTASVRSLSVSSVRSTRGSMSSRLSSLEGMVETKETQWSSQKNVPIEHNQIEFIYDTGGVTPLNSFRVSQGVGDSMAGNSGNRIGDQIALRGMKVMGFFEGALGRSKVHFRLMLIKMAKGDTISRSTLFQEKSDNKMLDMINTERYTVLWQKKFTVSPPNYAPTTVNAQGVPVTADVVPGITGNRIISAWIPGQRFAKKGIIRYENASATQVKFFDYRWVVMAYDWYGTPQDLNTVGRINEFYTVLYFKDA